MYILWYVNSVFPLLIYIQDVKGNWLALQNAFQVFWFCAFLYLEHNAAVEDLSELHWHVTYKKRAEEKLKDRVDHANAFNVRLLDDIAFVQKHWWVMV